MSSYMPPNGSEWSKVPTTFFSLVSSSTSCSSNPCQNGGTCSNSGKTYLCKCPTNYGGDYCQEFFCFHGV